MKKFYFVLVAMLVAVAAQAQNYYLIGGFNGWTTSDAKCKFTNNGDGTYVLDLQATLTPGFKVNDGTWSNANANFGSNGSDLVVGTPYAYGVGGNTGNIMMAGSVENPHIVLDINAGTLLIGGEEQEITLRYGIHGNAIVAGSNWETKDMTEENGKWVLANVTCEEGDFGIKSMPADGNSQIDWIWCTDASNVVVVNQVMNCGIEGKTNGKNWTLTEPGVYTFTFDPEAMTLVVSGETTVDDDYYEVYGDAVVAGSTWGAKKMTEVDGEWVLANVKCETGDFGIRRMDPSGQQVRWIYAADKDSFTIVIGEAMPCAIEGQGEEGHNWHILAGTYTFTYNRDNMTLTVTGTQSEDPEPIEPTGNTFVLHGQIAGNTNWEDIKLTYDNGNWTSTLAIVPGEFGIKELNTEGKQANWIAADGDANIAAEGTYNCMVNGTNFKSTLEGNYTITYDPAAMTITFTEYGGEIVEEYSYGIHGTIFEGGSNWITKEMSENNGEWTLTAELQPGTFGIKKMDQSGAQKAWFAATTATTISQDGTFELMVNGTNFTSELTGEYVLTLDPEAMTLVVSKKSGVANIEADANAPVEYYNLQGVRVANPENGLYIRRQGSKVTKVIL